MSENKDPALSPFEPQSGGEDPAVRRELQLRTRRSFIVAVVTSAAGLAAWRWLRQQVTIDGIPGPLRKMLGFNEALSRKIFDPARRMRERSPSEVTPGGPRANGSIGLAARLDPLAWRLRVEGTELALTLDDLRKLPQFSQITPLHCIEGWTTVARWTGVKFSDFTDHFYPSGRTKSYVSLATPDGDYYVGLDASSAFHDQTMLCYEINGAPLSIDHGAPLRLLIPTKYGIKNLKRVGEISFTDTRPPDYWAEQGYDWYAGF